MRRSFIPSTLISVASVVFVVNAVAADDSSLDPTVITATRIPTPESQTASSVTLITADDIAAMQSQSLPDVLKSVPGLNLVQEGGPGGQTSIFMRGTNSNHVKVLVDGIDVSDPSNAADSFDFSQFLTQDIEKIEILRGPQSGLYGSDAIGGVINIITRSGSGPTQATVGVLGGSFETFNQYASLSGSDSGFHYSANIEHLHSAATPVTPLDLLAPGERRIDDYYDNLTASTKLGYDITDQFDLGLVARYTDSHLHFTGEDYDNFPDDVPDSAQSTQHDVQYYTRVTEHAVLLDGLLDQTLGVAYSNIKTTDFSPDDGTSTTENDGNRLKIDWQGNIALASHQNLIIGAEHQRDEVTLPLSASTNIDSGYAELQSGFGGSFFDTLSVRYDDNDRFGGKATYRFAPVFLVAETGTKLKASVGSGFKAPTLSELFQSFPPYFFANPNLRPETSVGFDFGFEQALLSDTVAVGATYFDNQIKNLITANADDTTDINVGRARTDGVESFVSYRMSPRYSARLDYTYTQATDEILNEELLRRPKNKASLQNLWKPTTQLSLEATVLFVGSWIDGNRDFSIPRLTAPGYTIANIAASYDVNQHLSLLAHIDNLFDRHYENPIGFLQPSLGAYAGVKVRF